MLPSNRLNLLFPQWQGSGNLGLYRGAKQLSTAFQLNKSVTEIPVATTHSLQTNQNILGFSQICSQLSSACQVISEQNPDTLFTIGGDCGAEIAPVSFLNQKYNHSLAVLWLDAHGDLNTPSSSPSGHFHGMPLRVLLGEGNHEILQQAFSTLQPKQVFLAGTRELDRPEGTFIKKNTLPVFTASSINAGQHNQIVAAIKAGGFHKLYIHLDLDVLDPNEFPHIACPTPNGLTIESLTNLLFLLRKEFEVVGASILEFLPVENAEIGVEEAIALLQPIYSLINI